MTLFLLMSSLEQITQYFSAGNLWRWSNGGGDGERESQTSDIFEFRDRFRM